MKQSPGRSKPWRRWLPYALTLVGLVGGIAVASAQPFGPTLTTIVAAVCFGTAAVSVVALIVAHSGPGERGPDF